MHEVLSRAVTGPDETVRYGAGPEQVASVWWPRRGDPRVAATVMFLHGGFWRAGWDRTHAGPLAVGLAEAGFTVCLPEYRRTGRDGEAGPGGGWPGTFDDIALAVDVLPGLLGELGGSPAEAGVVLAGHSAGGHLSLWAAARPRLPADAPWHTAWPPAWPPAGHSAGAAAGNTAGSPTGRTAGPDDGRSAGSASHSPVRGVVALAGVSDLGGCYEEGLGDGAAGALMGGSPVSQPDRYALADPVRLLPIGVPLWLLHGSRDDRVPAAMSRESRRGRGRPATT